MPKIVKITKKLGELTESYLKTPLLFLNDDFLGVARLSGRHKRHTHDRDELFFVLDGDITVEVEGKHHSLSAGDAVLIERGEEHVTQCQGEAHVLIFEPRDIGTNYTE